MLVRMLLPNLQETGYTVRYISLRLVTQTYHLYRCGPYILRGIAKTAVRQCMALSAVKDTVAVVMSPQPYSLGNKALFFIRQ